MRTIERMAALAASAQPAPTPTPTPARPSPAGGLPDGPVARFLKDPAGHISGFGAWVWRTVHTHWPLVVLAAVLLAAVWLLLVLVVGWVQRRLAARATWLEIVPPAKLPAEGSVSWWHSLSGMLGGKRWGLPGRRRLAVEFLADKTRVRAGVWVPQSIPQERIERLISQVWPGAGVVVWDNPPMWTGMRVSAIERFPRGGEWTPLLDPSPRLLRPATEAGDEQLRVVLNTLDLRTQDGDVVAGVQMIVTRQRRTSARSRSWGHTVVWAPVRLLVALIDALASPNKTAADRARTERAEVDPLVVAEQRARDAKRAAGPHLRVTVRALAATDRGAGLAAGRWRGGIAAEAAAGFDDVARSTLLQTRRTWRAATKVAARVPGRAFAATMPELAALWHLPGEPGLYGMTGNAARTRSPGRDLPRVSGWQPELDEDDTDGDGDA